MQDEQLVEKLKDRRRSARLKALKALAKQEEFIDENFAELNANVQHRTLYSCFDATPSLAAYRLAKNGFPVISIVDYASLSGAKELDQATEILKTAHYTGAEVECLDEKGNQRTLLSIGIPRKNIKPFNFDLFFYRKLKNDYADSLVAALNARFKKYYIKFDAPKRDFFKTTGTEDIYYLLAEAIVAKFNDAAQITEFLVNELSLDLSERELDRLEDLSNAYYVNDLATALFRKFKIKLPQRKYKRVSDFVATSDSYGGISCLKLGEDLDETISFAKNNRIKCVFFDSDKLAANASPSEIYDKCIENGLLPLARVVLARPRKKLEHKFENQELADKYNETAFAVIGHEISSSIDVGDGLFSPRSIENTPDLKDRIRLFSRIVSRTSLPCSARKCPSGANSKTCENCENRKD